MEYELSRASRAGKTHAFSFQGIRLRTNPRSGDRFLLAEKTLEPGRGYRGDGLKRAYLDGAPNCAAKAYHAFVPRAKATLVLLAISEAG